MKLDENFINSLEVNDHQIIQKISDELDIPLHKVNATVELLRTDNSVPFISRYRKEVTGFLDEIQVRDISHQLTSLENLENRRIVIIRKIFEQEMLTEELYKNIMKATNLVELEDIYAPYKRKKKTRAMKAIAKGLEPLADMMIEAEDFEIQEEANKYIDEEKGVATQKEALQGAMDIIAERVAHDIDNRTLIRDFIYNNAILCIEGLKDKDKSVYQMYYDYEENVKSIKPHRILAINRGEREGELKVIVDFDLDDCSAELINKFSLPNNYKKSAIEDGLKRLLIPSINREIRTNFSDGADDHGIGVFSKNLVSLLMQPPIQKTRVIGIDPGIRTGCKGACLDETGKFLYHFVFYNRNEEEAKRVILDAVKMYRTELIAIGNGTGTQDVQRIVSSVITENNLNVQYAIVDEDGASVYSASDVAREEFPDLDLTIRGAISIARRLQDPLSELVKIDPKSIGVGLYQHDVNQAKLSMALDEVVESVVNQVGVDLNTASKSLLKYVSGISSVVAKNIVEYRNTNGLIKTREDLKKVVGIGAKTFEQAAGFLKIQESINPLDNTWVHPENYHVAQEILLSLKSKKTLNKTQKEDLIAKYSVSGILIDEIVEELNKPNRDPRDGYPKPIFQKNVLAFEDLKVGMKLTGKIKNVVDFGAFVDLGIKETALLHISQMSDSYIKNPHDVVKVGDVKDFRIIEIDETRKRISVSCKSEKKNFKDLYTQYVID